MRAKEVIKLLVNTSGGWVDYTDGLLNIEIVRGIQEYQGPWTVPDVGQLIVKSRNLQLDPYNNPLVRYNNEVRIMADNTRIFTGRISGIDVDYGPKNEDSVITINALDYLGTMQKHILSDTFVQLRRQFWDDTMILEDVPDYNEVTDFTVAVLEDHNYHSYAAGSINSGTPLWEALASKVSANLAIIYADANNELYYYNAPPTHYSHPFTARPIKVTFASDGTETSYRTISVEDGFERITNQFSLTTSYGEWSLGAGPTWTGTSTSATYIAQGSVDYWGTQKKTLSLPATNAASLMNDIFIETSNPQIEVHEISWDAMLDHTTAKTVDLYDNIHITHELPLTTIDRDYSIIGIRHSITESDWISSYTLKNFDYINTAMPEPNILVDQTTGDTNHAFTFSTDFPAEEIESVVWTFTGLSNSTDISPTVTWPTTGTKSVTVTVTNIFGWVKTSDVFQVTVVGAIPSSTFTYAIHPTNTNQVNFTFTGSGADSVQWDFGDGVGWRPTSWGFTPTKIYLTTGSYTAKVRAINSYGQTDSATQTFSITVPTPVTDVSGNFPIRYIKLSIPDTTVDTDPPVEGNQFASYIKQLKVFTSTGTNLAANKPTISATSPYGYLSNLVFIADGTCANNSDDVYQEWNVATEPIRLTNTESGTSVSSVGFHTEKVASSCSTGRGQYEMIVDLQDNYLTINSLQLYISGMKDIPINVSFSANQVNWFDVGQFTKSPSQYYQTLITMTETETLPLVVSP